MYVNFTLRIYFLRIAYNNRKRSVTKVTIIVNEWTIEIVDTQKLLTIYDTKLNSLNLQNMGWMKCCECCNTGLLSLFFHLDSNANVLRKTNILKKKREINIVTRKYASHCCSRAIHRITQKRSEIFGNIRGLIILFLFILRDDRSYVKCNKAAAHQTISSNKIEFKLIAVLINCTLR